MWLSQPCPMLSDVLNKQQKSCWRKFVTVEGQRVLPLQAIVPQWQWIRGYLELPRHLWAFGSAEFRAGQMA